MVTIPTSLVGLFTLRDRFTSHLRSKFERISGALFLCLDMVVPLSMKEILNLMHIGLFHIVPTSIWFIEYLNLGVDVSSLFMCIFISCMHNGILFSSLFV